MNKVTPEEVLQEFANSVKNGEIHQYSLEFKVEMLMASVLAIIKKNPELLGGGDET